MLKLQISFFLWDVKALVSASLRIYTSVLSPEGLFSFETLLENYLGLVLIQIQCEKEVVQPCSVRPRHECYSMTN